MSEENAAPPPAKEPADEAAEPRKSRWVFPDAMILILGMVVLVHLLSYIIPQGSYTRIEKEVKGKPHEVVVSGSYAPTPEAEVSRPKATAFLTAIPKGLGETADIIFFVFLIGGTLGVIRKTGAIDALLNAALHVFDGKPGLLVAGMMVTFALGSATIGMAEEYLPFLPILIVMCRRLGMDSIVAMGIICIGYSIGYGCATLNPFTVQIAQDIAGVPLTSGQPFKWILMVLCLAVGVHHLLSYANKVKKDPSASLVADVPQPELTEADKAATQTVLTHRRGMILLALFLTIVVFVWGIKVHEWYMLELSACFFALGLLIPLISGMSPNGAARAFVNGASELTGTALLIGFARAIVIVMKDAQIIDTVVHWIERLIVGLPAELTAVGMLVVQSLTNFLIPSGSGQAYVTMPIMKDLASLSGLTPQTAVLAYQMGDGFTNIIVPTNAIIMGMLIMAKIPYQQWFRFLIGYFLKIYAVCIFAMVIAVSMKYA